MKRLVFVPVFALLVACGGQTAATIQPANPTTPGGPGASVPGVPRVSLPAVPQLTQPAIPLPSAEAGATAAPTDSKVRIVNLYDPGDEAPFALDIYMLRSSPFGNFAPSNPAPGDQPVAHAEFGGASDTFDPGSLDGTEAWAAYRAGQPPTDQTEVWNFGQNVVPGGLTTIVIASSSGDPGSTHMNVDVARHDDTNPGQGEWTLPPAAGTLIVDTTSLEAVWGATQNVVFVKDGDTCLGYPGSTGQPEPALLGSPTDYTGAPTGTNSVIVYANDQSTPGCSGTPQTDPITANVAPGGFGYVFLYSTGASDLHGFFLPQLH